MSTWTEIDAQIDILLHESLIDDAIKKVSGFSSYYAQIALKVMDAAIATQNHAHLHWVIDAATPKADAIMSEGKSKYYDIAIRWIKRVKAAYIAADEEQKWRRYRQQITDNHGRKRKLMGLLKEDQL